MATSTLQTNENNDLFCPDGRNLVLLSGAPACAQDIRHKTLMRTGEDIYDVNNGVDYFGTVFAPQQDYDGARKSLSDAILSSPDTISIEQLDISIDGNTFNYEAQILTIYGPLPVSSRT